LEDRCYLDHLHTINALEDGIEKRDLLDNQEFLLRTSDINTVTDIEWVFDKQKDAGS
jgi:hypothetical protein